MSLDGKMLISLKSDSSLLSTIKSYAESYEILQLQKEDKY